MSNDNPFDQAVDDVEAEQQQAEQREQRQRNGFDVEDFLETLGDGPKNETIGVAVTEEQLAVWKQLRRPAEDGGTDVDVAQSVRDHIDKLANRNPNAAERAGRKLQIDREFSG